MVGKAENRSNAATAFFLSVTLPRKYPCRERFKVIWPDACLTESICLPVSATEPLYVVDNFVDD
jgi:hypothetical protein